MVSPYIAYIKYIKNKEQDSKVYLFVCDRGTTSIVQTYKFHKLSGTSSLTNQDVRKPLTSENVVNKFETISQRVALIFIKDGTQLNNF